MLGWLARDFLREGSGRILKLLNLEDT
jgi:hypothetical protein